MSTRNGKPIFNDADMTLSSDAFVLEVSADYNMTFQFFWSGLVGTGTISLFYGIDAVHWDKYPLRDLEQGVVYYDLPIVGGDDSLTFKINSLGSGFIKVGYVSSATDGLLTGTLTMMDNKHY